MYPSLRAAKYKLVSSSNVLTTSKSPYERNIFTTQKEQNQHSQNYVLSAERMQELNRRSTSK